MEKEGLTMVGDLDDNTPEKVLELRSIIMIYDNYHYEFRSVTENGIGAEVPFDESFYENLARKYIKQKKEKKRIFRIGGNIPDNLLYASSVSTHQHKIIWRVKAGTRPVKWQKGEHDGDYYFPDMVFGLIDNRLYVLIEHDGDFYVPDFPNFYEDGNMCHGTVKIKYRDDMTWEKIIEKGNKAFFNTYFSHPIKDTMFEKMKDANSLKLETWKKIKKRNYKKFQLLCWV